jgi:hypothetical protein
MEQKQAAIMTTYQKHFDGVHVLDYLLLQEAITIIALINILSFLYMQKHPLS